MIYKLEFMDTAHGLWCAPLWLMCECTKEDVTKMWDKVCLEWYTKKGGDTDVIDRVKALGYNVQETCPFIYEEVRSLID